MLNYSQETRKAMRKRVTNPTVIALLEDADKLEDALEGTARDLLAARKQLAETAELVGVLRGALEKVRRFKGSFCNGINCIEDESLEAMCLRCQIDRQVIAALALTPATAARQVRRETLMPQKCFALCSMKTIEQGPIPFMVMWSKDVALTEIARLAGQAKTVGDGYTFSAVECDSDVGQVRRETLEEAAKKADDAAAFRASLAAQQRRDDIGERETHLKISRALSSLAAGIRRMDGEGA